MTAKIFIITGSGILGLLGLIHFIYVLTTNKFHAYDAKVTTAMQQTTPVLTKATTLWEAWLGFNYSHSLGVLWVPLIYIPLAINHTDVLKTNIWLTGLLPIIGLIYIVLAYKYWFNIPLIGSVCSFICFSVAFYLLHLN